MVPRLSSLALPLAAVALAKEEALQFGHVRLLELAREPLAPAWFQLDLLGRHRPPL